MATEQKRLLKGLRAQLGIIDTHIRDLTAETRKQSGEQRKEVGSPTELGRLLSKKWNCEVAEGTEILRDAHRLFQRLVRPPNRAALSTLLDADPKMAHRALARRGIEGDADEVDSFIYSLCEHAWEDAEEILATWQDQRGPGTALAGRVIRWHRERAPSKKKGGH